MSLTWVRVLNFRKYLVGTPLGNRYEEFLKNIGENRFLPGTLTCYLRGKEVPCCVDYLPRANITSQVLFQCLQQMDKKRFC